MELELGLDDDEIFDAHRERIKQPCTETYAARLCPPLWFNEVDVSSCANIEAQTILKYQGDALYQEGKYEDALKFYQQCQDQLQPNNISMKRGVEEDKARCLLRMGQVGRALCCAETVSTMAQNFEQVTDVLQLLLDIYQTLDRKLDMLLTLKKLLLLHPNNSSFWIRLGDLYASLSDDTLSPSGVKNLSKEDTFKSHAENAVENHSLTKEQEISEMAKELDVETQRFNSLNFCSSPPESLPFEGFNNGDSSSGRSRDSKSCLCSNTGTVATFDALSNISKRSDDWCEDCLAEFQIIQSNRPLICMCCYTAARLLLRSVSHRLSSFAKDLNGQQLLKVESRLDGLRVQVNSEELFTRCADMLKVALNLTDVEETNASTNGCNMTPRQILCEGEVSQAFDRKWFSWLLETNICRDRLKLVLLQ